MFLVFTLLRTVHVILLTDNIPLLLSSPFTPIFNLSIYYLSILSIVPERVWSPLPHDIEAYYFSWESENSGCFVYIYFVLSEKDWEWDPFFITFSIK